MSKSFNDRRPAKDSQGTRAEGRRDRLVGSKPKPSRTPARRGLGVLERERRLRLSRLQNEPGKVVAARRGPRDQIRVQTHPLGKARLRKTKIAPSHASPRNNRSKNGRTVRLKRKYNVLRNALRNMPLQCVAPPVTHRMISDLETLVASGMFGLNVHEAAARIIGEWLWQNAARIQDLRRGA